MSNQTTILLLVCQPDEAWATYNIADDKARIAKNLGWPIDTPRLRAVSAITETLPQDFPESAVIVCGSRHMVGEDLPWMRDAKDFIRRAHRQGKPILGICFGHQLVCEALGGTVGQSEHPEKGMVEVTLTDEGANDPLFAGVDTTFQVAAHHSNSVMSLPTGEDVRALASNDNERYQALAIGDTVRTVQFHPEVSAEDITKVLEATKDKLLESGYFKSPDDVDLHIEAVKKSQLDRSGQIVRNFVTAFASK